MRGKKTIWTLLNGVLLLTVSVNVHAATFNSSNFSIKGNLGDSIAGGQSSTNYQMTSAGGESIAGSSESSSYKLGQGYIPTLEKSLELKVNSTLLAAHYPLDEGAGTVAYDSSANTNNGTLVGSPTRVVGRVGQALSVSNGKYVTVADNPAVAFGSSAVTMTAWVNINSGELSSLHTLISQNTDSFELNIGTVGIGKLGVSMKCSDGSTRRAEEQTASINSSGVWYHVAATFNPANGSIGLYVNGASRAVTYVDAQSACSGGLKNSTSPITLGARDGGSANMAGLLDEPKVYGRSLSAREIQSDYNSGLLGVSNSALDLNSLTPGISNVSSFDSIIQTDAPGYTLAINQDHDLQQGSSGATDFSQSFDAISNGTTLTTGNTGLETFLASGSGTYTSSNANPIHNNFARFQSTGTASTAAGRKDHTSSTLRYYRFYFRMASLPAATHTIMNVRDSTNATVSAIRMQSDGTLLFRDGNITVATSSTALSANQWTRIELFYNPASSSQTLRLFVGANANGSIPDETLNGSASNGASTDVAVGIITSQSNQTYDIDELATGTTEWIGSASTASIPAVSGTIASPVSWSEGSTKGLGFTLYGTNATALPGSWGSGGSYAALPGSGTTFYTRSGFTGGTKDILNMRLRLDTPLDQAPGEYVNAMTITGTVTP